MKRIILFLILLFPYDVFALVVPSNNAILMDQDTGRILYSKNINQRRLIASTTKIMTAIIAIESGKLDEMVKIDNSVLKSYGSGIYIKPGEEMSLRNLVYGLLLRSGNDAALAIEEYLGGHEVFIKKMNDKARSIGMKNTIFENSNGLDESNEENYSTVYDMALLMKYANNIYDFREIDSTKKIDVKTNLNYYSWTNKNKLLYSYKYATGGKTGYTERAKRTLVTSATKDEVNLICVTFVDSDDFNTHKSLYEYGFSSFKRYLVINKKNIKIKGYENAYVKNNYYYLLKDNERDSISIKAVINRKDDILGYLSVKFKNKEVHREPIYINKNKKIKWYNRLFNY